MPDTNNKIHEGRNIKRFREMLGIKQDALAFDLDMSQQAISLLEQKQTIDAPLLQRVADIMKLPVDAFKNMSDDQAINVIANTFHDFKDNAVASAMNYHCSFNPIDKVVELYDEKIALYERMLKEKDEMMSELKRLISK